MWAVGQEAPLEHRLINPIRSSTVNQVSARLPLRGQPLIPGVTGWGAGFRDDLKMFLSRTA